MISSQSEVMAGRDEARIEKCSGEWQATEGGRERRRGGGSLGRQGPGADGNQWCENDGIIDGSSDGLYGASHKDGDMTL